LNLIQTSAEDELVQQSARRHVGREPVLTDQCNCFASNPVSYLAHTLGMESRNLGNVSPNIDRLLLRANINIYYQSNRVVISKPNLR